MLQSRVMLRLARNLPLVASFLCAAFVAAAESEPPGLTVKNGWYVCDGKVVWGYAQHNGSWRAGQRPNLARRAPGEIGPNRTEDLDSLTDAMLDFAHPGFEHNFGLHVAYIRKCLDVLAEHDNVVMLCSEEYTGPLSFMQFWLDTVFAWERETGRDVQSIVAIDVGHFLGLAQHLKRLVHEFLQR